MRLDFNLGPATRAAGGPDQIAQLRNARTAAASLAAN